MNAIADNTDGLKQLSVERVWMEMGKIIPWWKHTTNTRCNGQNWCT